MATLFKRPTPGKIKAAITKEVSIVTEPANGDEFLVKGEDFMTPEFLDKMAKLGVKFDLSDDEEKSEQEAPSGEDVSKNNNTQENSLQEDAMDKNGVKGKKFVKALTEFAAKILELAAEAGMIGSAAASKAPALAAERDKLIAATGSMKESTGGGVAQGDGASVTSQSAQDQQKVAGAGAAAMMSKSEQPAMSQEDFKKALDESISRIFDNVFGKDEDESVESTNKSAEQTAEVDPRIVELEKNLSDITTEIKIEQAAAESMAKNAANEQRILKLEKEISEQREALSKMRLARTGSNSLGHEPPEKKEEVRKSEMEETFEGSPIGQFAHLFKQTHGIKG